jgi:hypothetical protein
LTLDVIRATLIPWYTNIRTTMNLTITVDDATLKKARIRALEEGTSVNAVLGEFLESYAGLAAERDAAASALVALSRESRSRRGKATWRRDDLHDR